MNKTDTDLRVAAECVAPANLSATLESLLKLGHTVLAVVPSRSELLMVCYRVAKSVPREYRFNIHDIVDALNKLPLPVKDEKRNRELKIGRRWKIRPDVLAKAPSVSSFLNPGQPAGHLLDAEEVAEVLMQVYQHACDRSRQNVSLTSTNQALDDISAILEQEVVGWIEADVDNARDQAAEEQAEDGRRRLMNLRKAMDLLRAARK